jgi:2-dehydropantoate 2-reductase
MSTAKDLKRRTIAVIGLGGIGGIAAACLRDADHHDVVGCARTPIGAMRLDRPEGDVTVDFPVLTDPNDATSTGAKPFDWVLLCTKAQDTESAGPWLRALSGPGTRVAVMQNGLDHIARVAPYIGQATAIPTVVYYNAERMAPDHVRLRHTNPNDMAVADDPDGRAFAALFEDTPLAVLLDPDLKTRIWRKLMINVVVNPITALTRQRQGVLHRPDVTELCRAILDEVGAVARADGALLDADETEKLMALILGIPAEAGTSMYFDVMGGRPLEADALMGAVVAAGKRLGVPTPLNAATLALSRAINERPE